MNQTTELMAYKFTVTTGYAKFRYESELLESGVMREAQQTFRDGVVAQGRTLVSAAIETRIETGRRDFFWPGFEGAEEYAESPSMTAALIALAGHRPVMEWMPTGVDAWRVTLLADTVPA